MRLFILRATGGTGRALLEQAVERGHQITAFVRSPQKLGPLREGLAVRQGDPRNVAELGDASLVTMPWCPRSARLDWDGRQSSAIVRAAP
jgi:putative NADH-flavin reductase